MRVARNADTRLRVNAANPEQDAVAGENSACLCITI